MKRIILLASFIIVAFVQVYIFSDPGTTTVQYPLDSRTITQKSYTIANPNPTNFNYGANWIWSNGSTRFATFETLFYTQTAGSGNIYIIANSSYYAYLNGQSIRSGFKYQATDQAQIYLTCGFNNLTINAENNDTNATTGGLIFQIVYYEGSTNCNNNGFYNYSSCACQCSGTFTCPAAQIAVGYPTCGCKCANQGFINCNANTQYYDHKTCSCKCSRRYCRQGFEQDPYTCGCKCIAKTCTSGSWNYNQCRCV